MSNEFIDALDKYLTAREYVIKEEAKGYRSEHWDDTYGFGTREFRSRLSDAKSNLVKALKGIINVT